MSDPGFEMLRVFRKVAEENNLLFPQNPQGIVNDEVLQEMLGIEIHHIRDTEARQDVVNLNERLDRLKQRMDREADKPAFLKLIDAFTEQWPLSSYGPAHVVLDDYNLWDRSIKFCLSQIEREDYKSEHSAVELAATRLLLEILLLIPEEERITRQVAWTLATV